MLNFLIFLYLRAFKISCSAEMRTSFIALGPGNSTEVTENANTTRKAIPFFSFC